MNLSINHTNDMWQTEGWIAINKHRITWEAESLVFIRPKFKTV